MQSGPKFLGATNRRSGLNRAEVERVLTNAGLKIVRPVHAQVTTIGTRTQEAFDKPKRKVKESSFTFQVELDHTYNPLQRIAGCDDEPRGVVLNAWEYADIEVYMKEYASQLKPENLGQWLLKFMEEWANNKPDYYKTWEYINKYYGDFIELKGEEVLPINFAISVGSRFVKSENV